MQECEFTVEDVRKEIRTLRAESAPGPDGVHPTVLKECEEVIAYPLWMIYQTSISTGELPVVWTRANVCPIFKKGDRTNPLN